MNGVDDAGIYARESEFLECFVQIGAAGDKILSVSFPAQPDGDSETDHPLLDRIDDYLANEEEEFEDVDVALTMATDQRTVLEAVREIPYGEQGTVRQVAMMAPGFDPDDEDDAATIREALTQNPAPLLIPDHRVRDGPSAAPPAVEQKLRAIEGL